MRTGLTDLDWLVRDYASILWKIRCGKSNFEQESDEISRIIKEISSLINADKNVISNILNNMEYNHSMGYLFLKTSGILEELNKNG